MMSLYSSNSDLLAALCILAPEDNVRVALVGLIEFLEDTAEDIVFDRRAIFECVAQGIVHGFQVSEWTTVDDDDMDIDERPREDFTGQSIESIVEHFRKQLGTEEKD